MPRKAAELSALAVQRIRSPGLHAVGGVAGLHLQVSGSGARSWILRAMVGQRRRDIGLGGYPDVTLSGARDQARLLREKIGNGLDPVEEARQARQALKSTQASVRTFRQCAESYIAAHEAGWKNAKHTAQWASSLAAYVYPAIGSLSVRDVGLSHVLNILEPIWTTKTETATRVRGRVDLVLDWAAARGYREGPSPARWRGHLDKLLPKPTKVARVEHHLALPVRDVPAFMRRLRAAEGTAARALEFTILTAARSGEVRGARWDEIDIDAGIWTVPAERMKAGREHRVPFSDRAVQLVVQQPRRADSPYVFAAARGGTLSDMSLTAVLRRMKVPAVPHGFRSTFRDWVGEMTNHPGDLAEMALAHTLGSKVEAAYRRGDMFDKRRELMSDWERFVSGHANATR